MKSISELHREAMELAEQADFAKRKREYEKADKLFQLALTLEVEAADHVPEKSEPTRSILYRSAATLALDCNLQREAERLAAKGLSGTPPDDIADELRDIIDRTRRQVDNIRDAHNTLKPLLEQLDEAKLEAEISLAEELLLKLVRQYENHLVILLAIDDFVGTLFHLAAFGVPELLPELNIDISQNEIVQELRIQIATFPTENKQDKQILQHSIEWVQTQIAAKGFGAVNKYTSDLSEAIAKITELHPTNPKVTKFFEQADSFLQG